MNFDTITIGGSEISVVMGLSRWKSPLRLWGEKRGEIEIEDISTKENVQLGIDLEEFVANQFTKRTGIKVRRQAQPVKHKEYPYMIGHLDRIVEGKDELLECKTCSLWNEKEWVGDEIPMEYILQVNWYLGLKGWRTGYIAVLIGGQKFLHKYITLDVDLFNKQVDAAKEFMRMIQENIPPMAVYNDALNLRELYPQNSDDIIEIQDTETQLDIDEMVGFRMELLAHIDGMEKQKKEIDVKLEEKIKEKKGLSTMKYIVTWNTQCRKIVDLDKIKELGLYEKCLKENKVRYLRVKNLKPNEGKL